MILDPSAWSWPQAMLVGLLAAHVAIHASANGTPMRQGFNGPAPVYSAPLALIRSGLILFLCAAGGFFR